MAAHAKRFDADMVIALVDAWVLEPQLFASSTRVVPWLPVDSEPIPEAVRCKAAQCWQRATFSQFGLRELHAAGLEAFYVPHGVDTNRYKPIPIASAREALGLAPDAFIVGMVATNRGVPSRKALPQCLQAFAEFKLSHPTAMLYLHTTVGASMDGNCYDLVAIASELGIISSVVFSPQYSMKIGFSDTHMATLYSAFDVLLSPSLGEGFGVPILEAQSCGCPVIVGDWTAMSELCFEGIRIPKTSAERVRPVLGGWQYSPLVPAIVDALTETHSKRAERSSRAKRARLAALAFDADVVTERYWAPMLAELAAQLDRERAKT